MAAESRSLHAASRPFAFRLAIGVPCVAKTLAYTVLTIGLCTGIVTPLKGVTDVQCPWSLQDFGASEPYVPLLGERVDSAKPGRCWPGGHACTGFALLALYFALRDRHPRAGRIAGAVQVFFTCASPMPHAALPRVPPSKGCRAWSPRTVSLCRSDAMQPVTLLSSTLPESSPKHRVHTRRWMKGMIGLSIVLAALAAWYAAQTRVLDVKDAVQWRDSGIAAQWALGNVVLLVRHAERCDRSEHVCLADPDGITVLGSQQATEVGKGLALLPQDGAERVSSPEVRTRQTAQFLFGQPLATQEWVGDCDKDFAQAALAHKHAGHNLVLVTHSGCIDQLEQHLHVPGGERSSAYASALFVAVPDAGRARLLGQVKARAWEHLLAGAVR